MNEPHAGPTIDFRLYFTGLVAFAPGDDVTHALLVDAREPQEVPLPRGGTALTPVHRPVVQFNWDEGLGDRRIFGQFDDAFGQKKGYWSLDKDILTLDPEIATMESDLEQSPLSVEVRTPTTANAASLEWLAPLRGKARQTAKVKPVLLAREKDLKASAAIVASVELERGRLRPVGFASEKGSFVICEFDDGTQRAMASVVEYHATVRAPSVRLVARKFDGSPGEVLELVPRQGSDRVEAWVLNLEWPVIARQQPPPPIRIGGGSENPEYELFSRLLDNPPGLDAAPKNVTFVRAEPGPVVEPCLDPGMRRLHFPAAFGGEVALSPPCSPVHAR